MKSLTAMLIVLSCSISPGHSQAQEVEVLTREVLRKKMLEMIQTGTGKPAPAVLPEREMAKIEVLTKPYLFLKGEFPEDALREELRASEILLDKLLGGAELPVLLVAGRDLKARDKIDREMLLLLVRLHRQLLEQVAEQYHPEAEAKP